MIEDNGIHIVLSTINPDKVLATLKEAQHRYHQISNTPAVNRLQLKGSGRTRSMDHSTIYFVEVSTNPHKLVLNLHNEQIKFSGSVAVLTAAEKNRYCKWVNDTTGMDIAPCLSIFLNMFMLIKMYPTIFYK